MICPECHEEKGCACQWQIIPQRQHKVCPTCAERIKTEEFKNDPNTRVVQANTVPILQRDQQTGDPEEIRGEDLQNEIVGGTD